MPITGGCLCGAVRYSIDADPIAKRTCWCRLCQYLGAGNATVNVGFPSAAVTTTGTVTGYASIADSGNRIIRSFCPTCGTPVFSDAEVRPQFRFVRAGTLDDPEFGAPEIAIWTAAAPSWACIDETIERIEGQPGVPLGGRQ